jgi:MtN3 and saliva related transmembrane protein
LLGVDIKMFFKILGMAAAVLTTSSFVPQAVKTIKTKDTSGISLFMYVLFTIGVLFWIIYGVYLKDNAITIANFITFIFASIILKYKIANIKKDKKL